MSASRYQFHIYRFLGTLLVASNAPFAIADDFQPALDTIVVTASRLDAEAIDISKSVHVITSDEISARQAPNVAELLRQVGGINVIQQGGRGGVTSVILRGGEANFTVVLIDGIKVNDPSNTRGGSYDLSYLEIDNIERIEIIRGPMSAIYGSDALAGVINVITRDGDATSRANVEVGGHGYSSISATLAKQSEKTSGSVEFHAVEDDSGVEGSDYSDAGFQAKVSTEFGSRGQLGGMLRYQNASGTSFPEESGGPDYAVIRDLDERDIEESHIGIFANSVISRNWKWQAAASRYQRDEDYSSPGIAPGIFNGVPPNSAITNFRRDQVTLYAKKEFSSAALFTFGGEWQREDGSSDGEIDFGFPVPTSFQIGRHTKSAFSEVSFGQDSYVVQASVRWDDASDIESQTNASAGVTFHLGDGLSSVRLNWGQGFKAPSFFALAHPIVGNPNLRPETATSVDVGYRREFPNARGFVEMVAFRNEYRDLIDFDPVLFTNVNRSEVLAQGIELSAEFAILDSLKLSANVTYLDSEITDNQMPLRGRPRWRGGVVMNWAINQRLEMMASVLALDEFYEVSIPTGGLYLEGYRRADLALKYEVNEALEIGVAVDNLFDADYREAVGFPAAGTRARLRASYRF